MGYPDVCNGTIGGKPVSSVLDGGYLKGEFIETIQKRGAAIINARKASSALSAARAVTNHMHDWIVGTQKPGEVVSMAVHTNGSDGYGIEKGLSIDDFSKEKMKVTEKELLEERELAMSITK